LEKSDGSWKTKKPESVNRDWGFVSGHNVTVYWSVSRGRKSNGVASDTQIRPSSLHSVEWPCQYTARVKCQNWTWKPDDFTKFAGAKALKTWSSPPEIKRGIGILVLANGHSSPCLMKNFLEVTDTHQPIENAQDARLRTWVKNTEFLRWSASAWV